MINNIIERRNISDEVLDVLYNKIYQHEFKPGQRIPLKDLEKNIGVSRTPILTALNRLAEIGLVEILPRKGIYIVEPNQKEIIDKFDIRKVLEIYAVGLFAQTGQNDVLEKLRAHVSDMRRILEVSDYPRYLLADDRFHKLIIDSCGNCALYGLYRQLNIHTLIMRIRYTSPENDVLLTQSQHEGIVEALIHHDVEEAQKRMEAHLERAKTGLVNSIGRQE